MKIQIKSQKIIILVFIIILMFSNISLAFIDTKGHWAESVIEKWSDKEYVNGYDSKFYPNNNITRAEFVAILNKVLDFEETTENPFTDISENDWYKNAVLSAYKLGIVTGYDGSFYPNDYITREQVCVILSRLFQYDVENVTVINKFNDKDNISDWAKNSVIALVERGFLNGDIKDNLNAKSNITKAETVVILNRIMSNITDVPKEQDEYLKLQKKKEFIDSIVMPITNIYQTKITEVNGNIITFERKFNKTETLRLINDIVDESFKNPKLWNGTEFTYKITVKYENSMDSGFYFPYRESAIISNVQNGSSTGFIVYAEDYITNGEFNYTQYCIR